MVAAKKGCGTRSERAPGHVSIAVGLTVLLTCVMALPPAWAVPNFARKYNVSCNVCHTRQPRLNSFGQRFQQNGYQMPGTEDGGTTLKDLFGGPISGVTLDEVTNFLSARLRADVQQADFRGETETTEDVAIVFPNVINLFFAGSATRNISLFLEGEFAPPAEEHGAALEFERAFLVFSNLGGYQLANLKIGKLDPSAFFAFPTHRQHLNPIFGDAGTERFPPEINRIPVVPLAFASKMYGLTRGPDFFGAGTLPGGREGASILPFEPFLFNAPAQTAATLHGRPFGEAFLYQVGVSREETAESDPDARWDWHVMLRYDALPADYMALQASAFYYRAPDAARPTLAPPPDFEPHFANVVGWSRFGFGSRVEYRSLDIYGAAIWDWIDKPRFPESALSLSRWDTSALGVSFEIDWLVNDNWLLGMRYDFMDPGGLEELPPSLQAGAPKINQDVSFLGLIAKFYPVPNIGLYARAHFNLNGSKKLPEAVFGGIEHPARNLRWVWTVGVDMAI